MNALLAIAWHTVRAQARRRLLRVLVAASLLPIGASHAVARLTIGNYDRTVLDVGLSTIEIVGVVMAIAVGVSIGGSAAGRDAATPAVGRPSAQTTRLLGGYLGLLALSSASASVMLAVLELLLRIDGYALSPATLCATLLLCVQVAVIAAIALLASAVLPRWAAVVVAVAAFVVGHVGDGIAPLASREEGAPLATLALIVRQVVPDLELFNVKAHAASTLEVPPLFALYACLYGACYAGAVLAAACLAFRRRTIIEPGHPGRDTADRHPGFPVGPVAGRGARRPGRPTGSRSFR